ncbi:MAG: PQQ-dependent sugar dehydrogenase [Candidatus Eiseniibacteriota bacterium]
MKQFSLASRLATVCTAAVLALGLAGAAMAQTAPNVPIITSPPYDGYVFSPYDVHMETAPFSDPDPGDTHQCTDWEIWSASPSERVWVTSCISGVEAVHTHLADGIFEGALTGQTSLDFNTDYILQVRHRDNTDIWSGWAQRPFSTGSATGVFPLLLDDVTTAPTPTWKDNAGNSIVLSAGSPPPSLRLDSAAGGLLFQFTGTNGSSNALTNPVALAGDVAARVVVDGGSAGVVLSTSRLDFQDRLGFSRTIWLPAIGVPASGQAYFWISGDGSTYAGDASQTDPDFSTRLRGSPLPWEILQPGFELDVVATGFQLPVNIAFKPNAGTNPDDPYFYVTELYGAIKVVSRDGTVSDYATDLLNFDPTGSFPGSGEQGLAGIVVDPATGDLYCGMLYDSAPPNGTHYPKVVRFQSTDGGRTASSQTTILNMPGETQGQSHFISNFTIGPDGKLYVHMGDGFTSSTALNLNSFRGKILRMNLNGTAPSDNPFYNIGDGITARDYVFAYGFRNPFGGAWRAADNLHYEVENGNGSNDRFARVTAGTSYGWTGDDATMTTNAIYNWVQTVGPVNMAWIQPSTFGGSGFPASKQDRAFVTESGATWATGTNSAKRVVEFAVSPSGTYVSGPTPLIHYTGVGKASAVGLVAGPDGLYLTDLYKDLDYSSPIDPGANVLRIRYRGAANFSASVTSGTAPLTVTFTDLSDVPGVTDRLWDFGDGMTSNSSQPTHLYASNGLYNVRLSVTGANGVVVAEKSGYVAVGSSFPGLIGTYYDTINLSGPTLVRFDAGINFNWGTGSPSPSIGNDTFSARWTGQVSPLYTQTYTFYGRADDGVRVWVNNQLIVDRWVDQSATETSGTIALVAGQYYDLRMEYYENGGDAVAQLSWSSPSQAKEIIPQSRLRTATAVTSADGPKATPVTRAMLLPAQPNPLRGSSTLEFALPADGPASLRIFNVQGAVVATVFDGPAVGQRRYRLTFDASKLAAGVYFQQLTAPGVHLSRKLVIVR